METYLFSIFLPILFALIILPLIIRFIIGKVIFIRIQKEHLEPLAEEYLISDQDDRAYSAFRDFLKGRINSPFMRNFVIKEDLRTLLLLVQNSYSDEMTEEPQFSFSVSDLIKCSFLLMEELDSLFNGSTFERIGRSRLSTFRKINRISGYYNIIYEKLPFLKILRKGRITGKLFRILLIPIIGLPSVLISIIVSIISLFLTEIIWRYFYSVLLIKCFSYALILYGERKVLIREKLEGFSADAIRKEAERVESIIDPLNLPEKSSFYEEAFLLYQKTLEDFGISPEKDLDFNGVSYKFNSTKRAVKKLLHIPVKAANQYNPFNESESDDRGKLLQLIRIIASPYNKKERFYDNLRLIDIFDSLYMISLLGYSRILGGSFILNNLSVDFLLTAKNVSDEIVGEFLQNSVPPLKRYMRSWRLYRKSRYLYKALRRGNAAGLLLSISGPIALEGIKSGIRDYVYRRAGRMALFCYESNFQKKKRLF